MRPNDVARAANVPRAQVQPVSAAAVRSALADRVVLAGGRAVLVG